MTVFADEGRQCFAKFGGLDIIESLLDIQLCEISESPEPIEDFPNEQKWVGFLLRDLVECLVVNDRSEFVIFLLEEEGQSPGRVSMINSSGCQVFVNPLPEFCVIGSRHGVELRMVGLGSFL